MLGIARNVVFGTTSQVFLGEPVPADLARGRVVGWFTIPLSSTACDTGTLASQAQSAAVEAGVNPSAYARWVYVFPNNACGFAGSAYIGGNPSQAWINGSLKVRTVGHELGHNLGLWHSHALNCGADLLGPSCSSLEYGDVMDTMGDPIGTSFAAHYNAFQGAPRLAELRGPAAHQHRPYRRDVHARDLTKPPGRGRRR